jgi:hypothetical protein
MSVAVIQHKLCQLTETLIFADLSGLVTTDSVGIKGTTPKFCFKEFIYVVWHGKKNQQNKKKCNYKFS